MDSSEKDAVLTATAYGPILAFRLGLQYLRLKQKAKKARKVFLRELLKSGMPRDQARCLADEYAESVSIRSLAKAAMASSKGAAAWE